MVEEYTFIQLADPQFGLLGATKDAQWLRNFRCLVESLTFGLNDGKETIPVPIIHPRHQKQTAEELYQVEMDLADRAVQIINTILPTFAVVCGDLVHAYPSSDAVLNAKQVQMFKNVFSKVDKSVALVCTCGNHDIGDRPTKDTIDIWKTRFGDDYFSFWVGNDQFFVLNSQLYKDSSKCPELLHEHNRWLDSELEENGSRYRIVLSHIPPFINDPMEHSGYFPLGKEVRLDLLARFSKAGVSHWFCGHYHRNAGGVFLRDGKQLEVIVTGATGANIETDPSGDALGLSGMLGIGAEASSSPICIVKVSKAGISHSNFYLADVAT